MRYVVKVYAAINQENNGCGDSKFLVVIRVCMVTHLFIEVCTVPAPTQRSTVLSGPLASKFQDLRGQSTVCLASPQGPSQLSPPDQMFVE